MSQTRTRTPRPAPTGPSWLLTLCTAARAHASLPTAPDRLIIRSAPQLHDRLTGHRTAHVWPSRTDRPAWHSPYGPPPRRSHRGRWSPVPGVTTPRPTERHGHLCGRCD
ncbi:hypothetical protein GCM10010329_82250 [Streptomyces spiroverticillatus]|uniref:Uncharacterized protein n=1 Tax=Streptomyces finlayi TaxID=67296 RepID=A0A918X9G9_9ACTN|nr:hypothetical protein [Streptomyces finlayi]GHA47327.1 hypothetical protein GCM10010329_82250 [Streptomyces spiroverticillatus]GHD18568.1 hypothetical protein GCM10010334_81550 [Streptomyces finlayi]